MTRKDKFLRQCCGCNEFKKKEDLIRITKDFKSGNLELNLNGNFFGRSVYICKNDDCISNTLKKKKIEKILHVCPDETLKKELHNCTK